MTIKASFILENRHVKATSVVKEVQSKSVPN